MPTPTKSPKPTKKRTSLVIFFSVLAVIVGVGAYFFVVWDIQARAAFTVVSDEALRIEQVGITPLENRFVKEVAKGDGLLSRIECIPDVKCPTVQKRWNIAIDSGQEEQALTNILSKAGYNPDVGCAVNICIGGSDNDKFSVSASLNKESANITSIEDSAKTWKEFTLNIQFK